jgi:hypothetical protein
VNHGALDDVCAGALQWCIDGLTFRAGSDPSMATGDARNDASAPPQGCDISILAGRCLGAFQIFFYFRIKYLVSFLNGIHIHHAILIRLLFLANKFHFHGINISQILNTLLRFFNINNL